MIEIKEFENVQAELEEIKTSEGLLKYLGSYIKKLSEILNVRELSDN